MARYAIVEDGVVTNVVEGTAKEAKKWGWIAGDDAIMGGTYDGSTFTAPAENDDEEEFTDDTARKMRDKLLSDTDWWAVSDRTMTSEQTTYRQALRDLPDHDDWPTMDWPAKP